MATTQDFVEYVCKQIEGVGSIRYRKMFGEYLIYVDERPTLVVCDGTVYVKTLACVENLLTEKGIPHKGAKEHYILDVDDVELTRKVARLIADNTPLPKKKN